jgi:hypothetical protein
MRRYNNAAPPTGLRRVDAADLLPMRRPTVDRDDRAVRPNVFAPQLDQFALSRPAPCGDQDERA